MKKVFYFLFIIFLSIFCFSLNNKKLEYYEASFLIKLLHQNLWTKNLAYDSSHILLIPMIVSYKYKKMYMVLEYRKNFQKLSSYIRKTNLNHLGRLEKLQFLYFVSWYLVLEKKYFNIINDSTYLYLKKFITKELKKIYYSPAWHWKVCGISMFPTIKDRILYKLNTKKTPKTFCRAIVDEELFVFGIAGNLYYLDNNEFLLDILNLAYKVFIKEGFFIKNRYIFQQGVWKDHPDYKYACYESKPLPKNPRVCNNVMSDSSHFHRLPAILKSLEISGFKRTFFKKVKKGLAKQFIEKVLVYPNKNYKFFRLKNYMSGHNGYYRVGYSTNPEGYGPYELSATFSFGWWSLLENITINQVYCYMYKFLKNATKVDYKKFKIFYSFKTNRRTILKKVNYIDLFKYACENK